MGEEPKKVVKKQVVLLDLSMFVLDLLNPELLSQNFTSDEILFEIPSALVTMIWAAKADEDSGGDSGKKLLIDFLAAHLRGIQNSPEHKKSSNPKTVHVINSIQTNFDSFLTFAYQRVMDNFAPLIQGGSKPIPSEGAETQKKYPIRQYEPVLAITESEQISLRNSYKIRLGLNGHPLYDLYFLQVHHAQSKGIAASPVLRRKLLAIGRITHNAIGEWRRSILEEWNEQEHEQEYKQDDELLVKGIVEKYVNENWKSMLLGFGLDLTLSYLMPGSGIVLNFASAFVSMAAPAVIAVAEEKTGLPLTDIILAMMAVGGFVVACIFVIGLTKNYFSSFSSPLPIQNIDLTGTAVSSQNTPTVLSTIIPLLIPTPTPMLQPPTMLSPTFSATLTAEQFASNNPNYCLYVVQPKDTLQSIAMWFSTTENDIRASDNLVNSGVFKIHQMIKVPVYCCSRIGSENGVSYFVQPKDNVFRLAITFSTSVEKIVTANNLDDSRYIQNGQMLCIPYH